jgi:peptide/nickel transport system permease protein
MYRYILKRLGFMMVTIFVVSAMSYFLMNMIPGSTAEMVLKYTILGVEKSATPDQIAQISSRYDLNDPLYVQFFTWLKNTLFYGNIGTSYIYHEPVSYLIALRLPATIILAVSSILISVVVGIPLGIYAALKENRIADTILRFVTIFGLSMPGFWLALILMLVFAVDLKLVPVIGYGRIENLILPSIALSIQTMAVIIRVTRTSMLETLGNEYIRFAIAKGLSRYKIIFGHALKNAMLPIITLLGFQMGHLLGGAMIIESIFNWPGVGSLLVNSITSRDIPVVQGCILVIAIMFLVVNLIVDISYTYLDPRIRYGG